MDKSPYKSSFWAVVGVALLGLLWANRPDLRPVSLQRRRLDHIPDILEFAMVADLDRNSRDPEEFLWRSHLIHGQLEYHRAAGRFSVQIGHSHDVTTRIATNNRSMELSDLVWWNGKYLAVCDYTGLVYKVRPRKGDAFPRFVLADGDGKSARTLKAEWMTTHENSLVVGGHGKEWVDNGTILGRGSEWVKVIDSNGAIRSYDWQDRFYALRRATNTSFPGYLSHEAVVFNPFTKQWIFLPRKASVGVPYDDETDESMGSNLLLLASEDFTRIDVRHAGELEDTWGFTSVALVPGSQGQFLLALKVEERGRSYHTKLTVLDLEGNLLLDPPGFQHVADVKLEGVEFLGEHENW